MRMLIGDVHGKFGRYGKIIKAATCSSVVVGDMGVGFKNRTTEEFYANPPYDRMSSTRNGTSFDHLFLRGNHDDPTVCKRQKMWIPDGHTEVAEGGTKIMYMGGAHSIDRALRMEGFDWWPDEELSQGELWQMMDIYEAFKPDVFVTHDTGMSYAGKLFGTHHHHFTPTRTGQAIDAMFALYKPKMNIFGHWHISKDEIIDGIRFICLAELETKIFDF